MPTDTFQPPLPSAARNFAVGAIACSVGLFGFLKLGWIETHVMLPLTGWQGWVGQRAFGAPALPIDVTLACSGADAMALCAGAILAYPAPWKLRAGGVAAGLALIIVLNSVRIGTLGRAAASPVLFETLHVYLWPALLILAIAGYVFGWMQLANAQPHRATPRSGGILTTSSARGRFALWAVIFVLLFVAASSLYLQSSAVLMAAALIARAGAAALRAAGIEATAIANILWTHKGGFEVTQECISTPLIPLYCAAVMAFCQPWPWRALLIAAAVPLFMVLGIARLLMVALPATIVGSPLFLVHAFYQILLAAVVVCAAVAWRRGRRAWRVSAIACIAGVLATLIAAPLYSAILSAVAVTVPFNDAQGAMASLPSFQAGLFVALTIATTTIVAWRVVAAEAVLLIVLQVATFAVCHALLRYSDLAPQIRDVRALAIAVPLAIVMTGLLAHERARN